MLAKGQVLFDLDDPQLVFTAFGLDGNDKLLPGVSDRDIQFVCLDLADIGDGRSYPRPERLVVSVRGVWDRSLGAGLLAHARP